jgi:hypothetical protein
LLTPDGSKLIEDFRPGDLVLSAPEDNAYATAEPKEVEEVFESRAQIWELRAGGQTILTTEGHPFFVQGQGWTSACDLEPGDLLRGPARLSYDVPLGCKSQFAEGGLAVEDYKEVLPGELTAVQSIRPTGRSVAVYNLRIADHHTYFVGTCHWGFSIWAHNACWVRSKLQKQKFLMDLAYDWRTPSWMKPWLSNGRVPPGYNVDHIVPGSVGGADIPSNTRLVLIRDYINWHHFYHPWR